MQYRKVNKLIDVEMDFVAARTYSATITLRKYWDIFNYQATLANYVFYQNIRKHYQSIFVFDLPTVT